MSELASFKTRKENFLKSIISKNPESINKYKRVVASPIRYPGGKSLAVGYIVELLPINIKRVISPFFGGGSVEITISKYLGLEVIGYDIFEILMNYWNIQIEDPELLYEKLKEIKPTEENFNNVKAILKDHWEGKIKLDPITLATYFFFNWNLSYGPGFLSWTSEIYLNEKKYEKND